MTARATEDELREKVADLKEAEAAIRARLMSLYPIGARFRFDIMSGQKEPSTGTVAGWPGGEHCYVRFRLERKAGTGTRKAFVTVAMGQIRWQEIA